MELFHILTIIISVVVFLGLFIYTWVIYATNSSTVYPKDMTACPDFWTVNPDGTCQIPVPTGTGGPDLNIGRLSQSQKIQYPVYTYPTKAPSNVSIKQKSPNGRTTSVSVYSGANLDTLLDISNISFLKQYNDPGNFLRGTPQGTNFPPEIVRSKSAPTGNPTSYVYRYDIYNSIPAGYSIRNPGAIDFKDREWATYGDPYCAIQSWVKQNGIAWDGMLAYNNC